MNLQIFLHRSQRWGNSSLLRGLNHLCTKGVRAFELDIIWRVGGLFIGHPANPKHRYHQIPKDLSNWAVSWGATILLDIKQSDTPDLNNDEIEHLLGELCPDNFLISSYDLTFIARIGQQTGLPACVIVNSHVFESDSDPILIVSEQIARQITPAHSKSKIIISGIESLHQIQDLVNEGFCRFISDDPGIAASATLI